MLRIAGKKQSRGSLVRSANHRLQLQLAPACPSVPQCSPNPMTSELVHWQEPCLVRQCKRPCFLCTRNSCAHAYPAHKLDAPRAQDSLHFVEGRGRRVLCTGSGGGGRDPRQQASTPVRLGPRRDGADYVHGLTHSASTLFFRDFSNAACLPKLPRRGQPT